MAPGMNWMDKNEERAAKADQSELRRLTLESMVLKVQRFLRLPTAVGLSVLHMSEKGERIMICDIRLELSKINASRLSPGIIMYPRLIHNVYAPISHCITVSKSQLDFELVKRIPGLGLVRAASCPNQDEVDLKAQLSLTMKLLLVV
jgi:hypothetical protein